MDPEDKLEYIHQCGQNFNKQKGRNGGRKWDVSAMMKIIAVQLLVFLFDDPNIFRVTWSDRRPSGSVETEGLALPKTLGPGTSAEGPGAFGTDQRFAGSLRTEDRIDGGASPLGGALRSSEDSGMAGGH
ncbi:hypothetical protein NPIL_425671 [Nephila pilipes]|uniref:Uncharacterized protein n=1 Tax=Nephila pilipes TaxID=299642 RepID=A0A8X6UG59_NEPPI|nr:hypothetical protein NPIL_425671 [Nephila pilipes]